MNKGKRERYLDLSNEMYDSRIRRILLSDTGLNEKMLFLEAEKCYILSKYFKATTKEFDYDK